MVSVVIPSYNREQVLKKAVESVLNQTWTDIEVIVVDDGSKDNTKEVIESIKDSRLRYVYQNNSGACAARNNGISLARGEYIAFHDSDDVWRPEKLEREMKAIENSGADIVFCKLVKHNPDGSQSCNPADCTEGFLKPIVNLFGIGTQTLLARREVFEEFRFDPEMPRFQEFELLYRATKKYSIYCVDEGLVDYYVGADSISSNPEKMYQACELLCKKHPEIITNYPRMAERMSQCLLLAANRVRKTTKKNTGKYVKFALKCHFNCKLLGKAVLILIGLYR